MLDSWKAALKNFISCVNHGSMYDAKVRKEALTQALLIARAND